MIRWTILGNFPKAMPLFPDEVPGLLLTQEIKIKGNVVRGIRAVMTARLLKRLGRIGYQIARFRRTKETSVQIFSEKKPGSFRNPVLGKLN